MLAPVASHGGMIRLRSVVNVVKIYIFCLRPPPPPAPSHPPEGRFFQLGIPLVHSTQRVPTRSYILRSKQHFFGIISARSFSNAGRSPISALAVLLLLWRLLSFKSRSWRGWGVLRDGGGSWVGLSKRLFWYSSHSIITTTALCTSTGCFDFRSGLVYSLALALALTPKYLFSGAQLLSVVPL